MAILHRLDLAAERQACRDVDSDALVTLLPDQQGLSRRTAQRDRKEVLPLQKVNLFDLLLRVPLERRQLLSQLVEEAAPLVLVFVLHLLVLSLLAAQDLLHILQILKGCMRTEGRRAREDSCTCAGERGSL